MEDKIINTEKDFIVYDRASGCYLRSAREVLDVIQEELTKIAEKDGYLSYKDMLYIISKDWPKEKRERFLGKTKKSSGWTVADEQENPDLKLMRSTKMQDGKVVIYFDLDSKNKAETPE